MAKRHTPAEHEAPKCPPRPLTTSDGGLEEETELFEFPGVTAPAALSDAQRMFAEGMAKKYLFDFRRPECNQTDPQPLTGALTVRLLDYNLIAHGQWGSRKKRTLRLKWPIH
jgi:hypothetical protein